jgi:murein DD-endopeptidase MepM/ murein hydrolase activator NlpD
MRRDKLRLVLLPFGSDGPEEQNPYRIHHGIDMPNSIGETVRAAASGTVMWAAEGVFQNSYSYGNVVLIQHEFSYRGQTLYTLYAHLSAALVQTGQHVEAGDAIALVGATGNVSGPHVHFEVRLAKNTTAQAITPCCGWHPMLAQA